MIHSKYPPNLFTQKWKKKKSVQPLWNNVMKNTVMKIKFIHAQVKEQADVPPDAE